ncbi:hypothetical protein ACEN9X_09855 [Mucilaginibacter sp. Mucisp86]|uniref:hypothetical protein n=1 Tax=Mucilaginibacter sp. Mucisp86 TaxID=3243060 RepID=UPI0039B54FA3
MKKILSILLVVLIMAASCKKDNKSGSAKNTALTDPELIAKSKAWYEATASTNSLTNTLATQSISPTTANGAPGNPDWSNALVKRNKNGIDLVSVPFTTGSGTSLHLNAIHGRRQMLLYGVNGAVKEGYWIERDSDYNADKKSFTGNVLTYDLNNKFISGEKYVSGVLTSIIQLDPQNGESTNALLVSGKRIAQNTTQSPSTTGSPNRFYKTMGGGMICIDWYVRGCVPATNTCSEWRWDGQTCTEIPSPGAGPGTLPSSGGSGGTGGGGGGGGGGHTTPPGTGGGGGAISADPYTEGGSVGYAPETYNETIPDVAPVPSDFYTCPTNFAFVSVTTHDLWQESVVTDVYCHIVYDAELPELSRAITVEIPELHFGLPYINVEGMLVYSAADAANISADALNEGEYEMRRAFYANRNLTKEKLSQIWVNQAKQAMLELSKGRGRVGKTGSLNAIKATPARIPYKPCV